MNLMELALTKENAPKKFAVVVDGDYKLSESVQNFLFKNLDARWRGGSSQRVQETHREVLFVEKEGDGVFRIGYGTKSFLSRERDDYPEMVIKQELTLFTSKKVVEIDGKVYDRDALYALLESCGLSPL